MQHIRFLSVFLLALMTTGMQAAKVSLKMNTTAKTMTLKDAGNQVIEEDAMTTASNVNTYVFNDLPDGVYTVEGFNTKGLSQGTIRLTVNGEDIDTQLFTITTKATNSGWIIDSDYTVEVQVVSNTGVGYPVTVGYNADPKITSTAATFFVPLGGSCYVRLKPNAAHQTEGYGDVELSRTITANATANTSIPVYSDFTCSCPEDAEIMICSKSAHYVPFTVIPHTNKVTTGGTTTYTYRLANNTVYNLRTWREGGLTNFVKFTYNTDATKCPELNFTDADYTARSSKFIEHDPAEHGKSNVANILVNINERGFKTMSVGETYDLIAQRDWQLTDNTVNNYFVEPDYHYAVYDLNGNPDNSVVTISNDVQKGSAWATMTAVGTGTAIVTVTYDAIAAVQYANKTVSDYYGGKYWGAVWPENTGVFVVTVGAGTNDITPNMVLNQEYNLDTKKLASKYVDAEHDVFYYINDEEAFNYTFTPSGVSSVAIAYPTIRTNDAVYNTGWQTITKNADNSYTLPLKHGRQIVRLSDAAGHEVYQVLTAKHATRTITNVSTGDNNKFSPGDNIKVQYDGIFHPANKMSGIYNMSAYITYNGTPTGTALILGSNQYAFGGTPSAQAVSFTIPYSYEEPTLSLTDGVIQVNGFGDPIGNHRNTSKTAGRSPNFTAIAHKTYFGALPDMVIPVTPLAQTKATIVVMPAEATCKVIGVDGVTISPDAEGKYTLKEGLNIAAVEYEGYKRERLELSIGAHCSADTTIYVNLTPVPENGWDGHSLCEVTQSADGYYHVQNGCQLAWIAERVNSKQGDSPKIMLDNDIDLCNYPWKAIGKSTSGCYFKGVFDGQDHAVYGLHIDTTASYQGLFGYIYSATIKNVSVYGSVRSATTSSTGTRIGGIAGYATGTATAKTQLTNVFNHATVTGTYYVGGLIGYIMGNTTIDRCGNYGDITAVKTADNKYGTNVAGIGHANATTITITNSFNQGTVLGDNNVGGIYCATVNTTVTNVYNTGYVHASGTNSSGYSCHGAIRPMANTTAVTNKVTNAYADEDFLFNELNTTIITTPEAWTGGEVAYKLGDAFGQEIGVDPLPVLGGMKVYECERPDGTKFYANQPYECYQRKELTVGRMGTICIAYASDKYEGATFYRLLHKKLNEQGDAVRMVLEEVTVLEAGMPYVFVPDAEEINIYYLASSEVNLPSHFNGLYGTFEPIQDGEAGNPGNKLENNYIISDNIFQICGHHCSLKPNRAYIKMDEVAQEGQTSAPQPVPGRRQIIIGGTAMPKTPTGLEDITNHEEQSIKKVLRNGRLYIIHNGQIYDVIGNKY